MPACQAAEGPDRKSNLLSAPKVVEDRTQPPGTQRGDILWPGKARQEVQSPVCALQYQHPVAGRKKNELSVKTSCNRGAVKCSLKKR